MHPCPNIPLPSLPSFLSLPFPFPSFPFPSIPFPFLSFLFFPLLTLVNHTTLYSFLSSREEVKGALGFLNASMEESELHAFLEQLPDQLPLENLLEKIKEQNDEVEWVPPFMRKN